jgi:hypothetical protein
MATRQAVVLIAGTLTLITTADTLAVGSGITTTAGNLSITSAGGTTTLGDATLTVSGTTTFTAAGTAVTVNNNMTVTGTLTAGAIVAAGLTESALTTAAMTGGTGQAGYVSAASTLTPTDNLTLAKSRFFGVYTGTAGQMTVAGVIAAALFTTVGGSPTNGSPVWLAASTDEAAAVGKFTATLPASGTVVAEVGICLDNTNYAGAKTAKILIQVKSPVQT